ncbi:MAG TPA: iron-sulfur cluster assembly protein [Rubricoccaceae bacterium]|jgi:metal-sulfur cluster biosynthetic enzyme
MDPIVRDFLITGREVDDLTPLEEAVRDVCRGIYDPEIPVPIWDLGLIYGWTITPVDSPEGDVRVDVRMTLTAPNCPAAESLPAEVRAGVGALDSVAEADVEIVFVPSYSMEMLGDEARLTLGLM